MAEIEESLLNYKLGFSKARTSSKLSLYYRWYADEEIDIISLST